MEAAGRRATGKGRIFYPDSSQEARNIHTANLVFLICWKAFGRYIRRGGRDLFFFCLLVSPPPSSTAPTLFALWALHRLWIFPNYFSERVSWRQSMVRCLLNLYGVLILQLIWDSWHSAGRTFIFYHKQMPLRFHQRGHWGKSEDAEKEELDSTHSSYLIKFIGLLFWRSLAKKYF